MTFVRVEKDCKQFGHPWILSRNRTPDLLNKPSRWPLLTTSLNNNLQIECLNSLRSSPVRSCSIPEPTLWRQYPNTKLPASPSQRSLLISSKLLRAAPCCLAPSWSLIRLGCHAAVSGPSVLGHCGLSRSDRVPRTSDERSCGRAEGRPHLTARRR